MIADRTFEYICMYNISWKFPNKKTKTFEVRNIKSGDLLGHILWSSSWRQYVFETITYYKCHFSKGCNLDINKFIDELMEERRNEN